MERESFPPALRICRTGFPPGPVFELSAGAPTGLVALRSLSLLSFQRVTLLVTVPEEPTRLLNP